MTTPDARQGLTPRQTAMLVDSEPDDLMGEEGAGVSLLTGADYVVAKSLERRGFGYVEGPGDLYCGLYFNNAEGLALRRDTLGIPDAYDEYGEDDE